MKRRSSLLAFAASCALLLAACGDTQSAPAAGNEEASTAQEATPAAESTETTPAAESAQTTPTEAAGETAAAFSPISVDPGAAVSIPDNEALAFTRDMKVGWNLGNTFDTCDCNWLTDEMDYESAWCQVQTTKELIATLKSEGFNSIRIPVSWHNHVDAENQISEPWLARVEEVVGWACDEGMYVILNIHHDEEQFYPSYEKLDASKEYVSDIWTQLAERFADYDEHLIFETMNEPRQVGKDYEWWIADKKADYALECYDCINQLNQTAVDTIRANGKGNNAQRYIMVPSYCAAPDFALVEQFSLPEDPGADNKLIVSIHAYTPYNFALNTSGTDAFSISGKNGTGDIDYFMKGLYDKFISQGIPVVIGEWGSLDKSNLDARLDHAAYYVTMAKHYGMPTLFWDNNAYQSNGENFGLIDRATLQWRFPELKDQILFSAE